MKIEISRCFMQKKIFVDNVRENSNNFGVIFRSIEVAKKVLAERRMEELEKKETRKGRKRRKDQV